ncbi:MAG: thiol-activated cytolysin family protein [Treponema sp.]
MLQTKNIGWLTKLHVHTKVLLLLVAMASMGCKQPMKQTDIKQTPQTQKTEAETKKNTKQEGEKKNQKKQEGNKEPAKENTEEDGSEEGAGELTYAGLPMPARLSKTPEEPHEDVKSEEKIGETEPMIEKGIPVKYIEKKKAYRIAAAIDENLLIDPESESLYPGVVLAGPGIDDGSYRDITEGKRRKAVYSCSLQGAKTKSGTAGTVTGEFIPNLADYRNFHNKVLTQKIGYAASISSSYEEIEIKSKSAFDAQFKIGVGFAAAGLKAKIGSGFKFKSGEEKKRYLIRFTETFYTVNINPDSKPLMTDIPKEMLGESMPVYVSSVSYGRLAYLSIETDKEWKDIKPHIDAVLKCKPNEVSADVSAHIEKLDEMTATNITIIGGSGKSATKLTNFRDYIVNGGFSSGNPGQIIKYKLRFLHDNAPAYIKYAELYDTIEKVPLAAKGVALTAQVKSITSKVTDGVTLNAEIYGTIKIQSQRDPKSNAVILNLPANNVLRVPYDTPTAVTQEPKTITLPNTTGLVCVEFNIKEQNIQPLGDRVFYLDPKAAEPKKRQQLFKPPEKQVLKTFTLINDKLETEKVEFTIEFKTEYVFP